MSGPTGRDEPEMEKLPLRLLLLMLVFSQFNWWWQRRLSTPFKSQKHIVLKEKEGKLI